MPTLLDITLSARGVSLTAAPAAVEARVQLTHVPGRGWAAGTVTCGVGWRTAAGAVQMLPFLISDVVCEALMQGGRK